MKNEWVPLKIGLLLFIDRMVSNDAAGYALVKAKGRSRRRRGPKVSLYKGIARSDNCPPRSVGGPLPLPPPPAVGRIDRLGVRNSPTQNSKEPKIERASVDEP